MNDQKSLKEQLDDLERLAGKHGLYDAQDYLKTKRKADKPLPFVWCFPPGFGAR